MDIYNQIEDSWKIQLKSEFNKRYMNNLINFLSKEKENYIIYPKINKIFNAFNQTPIEKVKIVIIGQDPYHGKNQAHGLSFSVPKNIKNPPSLVNIFREMENDIGINNHGKGDLTKWARQGVLLLNSTLTVRSHQPGSHQNKGWEEFTDKVISLISMKKEVVIFMLWGKFAQKKIKLIDKKKHYILISSHPSPLSSYRGFFGCKHFSKSNRILKNIGKSKINWQL